MSLRESEVLPFLVKGHTSKEIVRPLALSPKTVDVHRANILRKMKTRTVPELMRKLEPQLKH